MFCITTTNLVFFHAVLTPTTNLVSLHTKAKQAESSDLCDNITEFRIVEEHLSPQGDDDLPPPQSDILLHLLHY